MAREFCPECGYQLHRSHSRNFHERFVRAVSRLKLYRCHDCGWRGWRAGESTRKISPIFHKKILPFLLTVLVALLLAVFAVYFINSNAAPSAPAPAYLPELICPLSAI